MIALPLHSSRTSMSVVFATFTCLSVAMVSTTGAAVSWALMMMLILVMAALRLKNVQALHVSLFCTLLVFSRWLPTSHTHVWPFKLLGPLLVYAAIVISVPALRQSVSWVRAGSLDRNAVLLVSATILASSAALIVWYLYAGPEMSLYVGHFPDMPAWLLPLAAIGFALLNAAMEETGFRGIIMQALESSIGPGVASILVQAVLFGAVHYLHGFPNGATGAAMASAYGILLGYLRHTTRGMLAPCLTHFFADLTIFAIVAVHLWR